MKLQDGIITNGNGNDVILTAETDLTFRRLDEAEQILEDADISHDRYYAEVKVDLDTTEEIDVIEVYGVTWEELEEVILKGYKDLGII